VTDTADGATRPARPADTGPVDAGPIIVVTAIALSPLARGVLADRLGPGHVVVDIRDAGDAADIVLIPPASPQLLGSLRAMFPRARLLITEFTDDAFGAAFAGPVAQSINSGADGYFVAPTIDELASATQRAGQEREPFAELTGGRDAGRTSARPQLPHPSTSAGSRDATPSAVHIDLPSWAEQLGVDIELLRRLAAPLLSQLEQQGLEVSLIGSPKHPAHRR
jgi:hypothetical protein